MTIKERQVIEAFLDMAAERTFDSDAKMVPMSIVQARLALGWLRGLLDSPTMPKLRRG